MAHLDPVDILLVEDNPYDVELILRGLEQHNVTNKVRVVKDGAEALDFIFCTGAYAHRTIGDTPKVVLLDLKLPKIDGLEVLQRIKSDERTKVIPVIVLTSSQEKRDIVESYRRGANSYMVKPIECDQLFRCVAELGFYWLVCNKPPC